jgi:hypothetical protein
MAESQKYVRCTNAFFVSHRGIVNVGEVVGLLRGEAMDVVSANRGEYITPQEFEQGPKADFKPKDGDGKVIVDAPKRAPGMPGSNKRPVLQTAGA